MAAAYVERFFMTWMPLLSEVILFVAAVLHWRRTRHWCLFALAIGVLLVTLGAIGMQIMELQAHPVKHASGMVTFKVELLPLWMEASGAVVAAVGGIGAIFWAIKLRRPPEARSVDPTFGELRRSANSEWTGEVTFWPIRQRVSVSVDASEEGPTNEQKLLFVRIQEKYDELLPEISRSLAEYVEQDWQFELCDIELPADPQSDRWTAQYKKTGEENFMGYFVDVVNWKVAGITGVD